MDIGMRNMRQEKKQMIGFEEVEVGLQWLL